MRVERQGIKGREEERRADPSFALFDERVDDAADEGVDVQDKVRRVELQDPDRRAAP